MNEAAEKKFRALWNYSQSPAFRAEMGKINGGLPRLERTALAGGMRQKMKNIPGGRGFKPKREGSADPLGPNSEIGRKLKEYYNDLVAPEVPDRFEELLSRLAAAEQEKLPADSAKMED